MYGGLKYLLQLMTGNAHVQPYHSTVREKTALSVALWENVPKIVNKPIVTFGQICNM